jgi:glycine cleavage system H protein
MNEYDDGKIWYRKKGGVVTVGLTEKAFEEMGGLQGINLPVEGDDFSQDDVVCEIEGDRQTFEVISPIDGGVIGVNEALNDDLELLQSDPLDEGWLFKMRVAKESGDESDDEE